MDVATLMQALRETAAELGSGARVTLVIMGGSAGLLGGWLRQERVTRDCDVGIVDPEQAWSAVLAAAKAVEQRLGLPQNWLNRQVEMYSWCLPLGWQGRSEEVERIGAVEIRRLARIDLICAKVMGAPKRPQDRQDLQDLQPTVEELTFAEEHLDRLSRESLDNERFEEQLEILAWLREML